MQGVYVNGRRPKSKKEIREAVDMAPVTVDLESTSVHGGEYGGPVTEMPLNKPAAFVGPCPYTSRKFYGTITRTEKGIVVK